MVEVKSLVWRDGYRDSGVKVLLADTLGGVYAIRHLVHDGIIWLDIGRSQTVYPTVEAAQADAQVDYERRILAALASPAEVVGTPPPQTHLRPLELLDRADDEAIEWVTSNLTAIRRDDGSLHYNLTQIVRAFQAGKERS